MSKKNKIINELIDLGLPMNGDYFKYWYELLTTDCSKGFKDKNTTTKYKYIAKRFGTTYYAAERMLRYGKKMMEKRIEEKYNISSRITNETVIILFELMVF